MNVFIYAADVYCESCGLQLREEILNDGNAPQNPDDETTYDSDEFPKGPYGNSGGEADYPQHCSVCGLFLENEVTE